jgi:hypothetical protein
VARSSPPGEAGSCPRGVLGASLDPAEARRCGRLLARAGTIDVVDAALALLVETGDTVVTSDPGDVTRLLDVEGSHARVLVV